MDDPRRGNRAAWRRPFRRLCTVWAAVWFVVGLGGGCEFRTEPVRPAIGAGFWPAGSGRATGDAASRDGRDATRMDYVEGSDAAARLAAAEGRPLLLVFGAEWCRWSGELARGPLADHDVVARTRRFVCAFVDADREPATCAAFGVTAFPTVILLDAEGGERFRATGSDAAGGLAAALDAVPSPRGSPRRLADERKDVTR